MKPRKPSIGERIDVLASIKLRLAAAEKVAKECRDEFNEQKRLVIVLLKKQGIDGAVGLKKGRVRLTKREFVSITNRRLLNKFVYKNRLADVFQGRVSMEAFRALREDGTLIPGVKTYEVEDLSFTKRK